VQDTLGRSCTTCALGHRPLQLPLHLLHAARRVRPDYAFLPRGIASFEEIARWRAFSKTRGRENPPDRREPLCAGNSSPDRKCSPTFRADLTLTTTARSSRKKRRHEGGGTQPRHGRLTRWTRSIPRINDADFPVSEVLERASMAAAPRARADPRSTCGEARRERGFRHPMARYFKGSGHHRALHRVHWRRRDQRLGMETSCPGRDRCAMIGEKMPLDGVEPNYTGEVAERWRHTDGRGIGVISSVTQASAAPALARAFPPRAALYLPFRPRRDTTCALCCAAAPPRGDLGGDRGI